MKKTILFIILILTFGCFQAQMLRMGPYISYNYTSLPNSNISSLGSQLNYTPSYCASIGATGVYNFDQSFLGIEGGLIYAAHNENYAGTEFLTTTSYYQIAAETKLKYLDIPVLLRVGDYQGFYGEIGPEFSFLLSSNSSVTIDPSDSLHPSSSGSYGNDFSGFCLSGIIGGGYTIKASKTVYFDLGFRFAYSFTDVTSQISQSDSSAHSLTSTYATFTKIHYNPSENFGYASTSRVSFGIYLGMTFVLEGDSKFNNRFR